jgi:hypothetical protein
MEQKEKPLSCEEIINGYEQIIKEQREILAESSKQIDELIKASEERQTAFALKRGLPLPKFD